MAEEGRRRKRRKDNEDNKEDEIRQQTKIFRGRRQRRRRRERRMVQLKPIDATKGGHSPKVVASPPIRAKLWNAETNASSSPSHLLLPYWTQKPRVGANGIKSACASEMQAKDGPRTLHSKDNGKSWHPLGSYAVRHEDSHRKAPEIDRLLEGAI